MSTNQYSFGVNYKSRMEEYVQQLEQSVGEVPRDARMQMVEDLTDAYVEQTGKTPDGPLLERLANVILHEELSDSHPDKMTLEEYPIMSERMYKVRTQGSERKKNKAGVVTYEVPITHGVNVATDGTDYTPNTRSFHNSW